MLHLFPACDHRLYLFGNCLRERALKAQQIVFTASPTSSTSQEIFVCESSYDLFSACVSEEEGISPSFSGKDKEV